MKYALTFLALSAARYQELIRQIQEARQHGRVYVHCAIGHGRSATVVAGCLLESGEVANEEAAEKQLQLSRPGVKFKPEHLSLLNSLYGRSRGGDNAHARLGHR